MDVSSIVEDFSSTITKITTITPRAAITTIMTITTITENRRANLRGGGLARSALDSLVTKTMKK